MMSAFVVSTQHNSPGISRVNYSYCNFDENWRYSACPSTVRICRPMTHCVLCHDWCMGLSKPSFLCNAGKVSRPHCVAD